jgi:hypothetical protein
MNPDEVLFIYDLGARFMVIRAAFFYNGFLVLVAGCGLTLWYAGMPA